MRKREQEAGADAARKATYAAALEREAVRVASIQASWSDMLEGGGFTASVSDNSLDMASSQDVP